MNFTMVTTAQWDGKFVAHFASERPALRKAHVVGIRWLPAANQARLIGNEADMIAVADSPRFRKCKYALVNLFRAALSNAL
jgi:hypothetical protein